MTGRAGEAVTVVVANVMKWNRLNHSWESFIKVVRNDEKSRELKYLYKMRKVARGAFLPVGLMLTSSPSRDALADFPPADY